MSIISETVNLPLIAVDRLWTSVAPGRAHPALGLGDMWVDEDARPRVDAAIDGVLAEQNLGTLDKPAPELVETLRLLATATEEYYAWVNGIPTDFSGAVLVSGNGSQAVLMTRDQQGMRLEGVPAEKLAEQLIDVFNPVAGAEIPHLTVPQEGFSVEAGPEHEAMDDDGFTFSYESDADEVDAAARLRELMHAKREAIYQVYTAKRAGGPNRKRVGPYAVVDIVDEGRVVTFVDESGAEPMIQCLSGGRETLVKLLTEAHAALG